MFRDKNDIYESENTENGSYEFPQRLDCADHIPGMMFNMFLCFLYFLQVGSRGLMRLFCGTRLIHDGWVGVVHCFYFFYFYLFFCFVFLPFFGLLSRHMEVPRLGV